MKTDIINWLEANKAFPIVTVMGFAIAISSIRYWRQLPVKRVKTERVTADSIDWLGI